MDATELHDLLEIYRENLQSQLKTDGRPVIVAFTEVARDNKIAAKHLVHVIEQHVSRVSKVEPASKLPALYLIDSIVKLVGEPYISEFSRNLPAVVRDVWVRSDERTQIRVRKVVSTWHNIFAPAVLSQVRNVLDSGGAVPSGATYPQPTAQAAGHVDPRRRLPLAQAVYPAPTSGTDWNGVSLDVRPTLLPAPLAGDPRLHATHPGHLPLPPTIISYPPAPGQQSHAPGYAPVLGPPVVAFNSELQLHEYRSCSQGAASLPPPVHAQKTNQAQVLAAKQTKISQLNIKEFSPVILTQLQQKSQKTKRFILDNNFQRQRRRNGKTAPSRQWFAPQDMWIAGTARDAIDEDPDVEEGREEATESEKPAPRFVVRKDEAQTNCAISLEPFDEEWYDGLQDWVYLDAVRLPPEAAAELGVAAGAIVKVGVLDGDLLERATAAHQGGDLKPPLAADLSMKRPLAHGGCEEGPINVKRIKSE